MSVTLRLSKGDCFAKSTTLCSRILRQAQDAYSFSQVIEDEILVIHTEMR